MEQDCFKCKRKDIKYSCIDCKTPVCNVCAVPCSEETPGYSEESYRVGKCDDCMHGLKRKLPDSKSQQPSLTSFFNKKTKKTDGQVEKPQAEQLQYLQPQVKAQTRQLSTEASSLTSQKSADPSKHRALTAAAANRWKANTLAIFLANEWLVINTDKDDYVTNLNCSVCKAYAKNVRGIKNFSKTWAFTGSTNLRLSNAEDHARGEPHKRALDLHLRDKGGSANERAMQMKASNTDTEQQLITSGIRNMQLSDLEKTRKKFETAYFIAKEEMPLTKYPKILQLEEKHGVEIGAAYCNNKSCTTFIDFMARELGEQLKKKLSEVNFFSVLTDGSEDTSVTENEAVFVQFLEKNPPQTDKVQIVTAFLRLVSVQNANAKGIVRCIEDSFKSVEITEESFERKLIGFAADGAAVNRGEKEGIIALLKARLPWVIYIWCIAHRLELSLKDALQGTVFDDVDEVLLRLYYLYEKSPKKLRELRELHDVYRQTFEFEEGGVRPKRACGTRWITHKWNALRLLCDKYGIYIQHLQTMSEDKSYKATDRQKFKGWLRKWQKARIPLLACLFIEILSPAKMLSLAFQDEEIDTVSSVQYIESAKKQLERLERKEFEDLPTVKSFLDRVEESDGKYTFQNVVLPNFQEAKQSAKTSKRILISKLKEGMQRRIETAENKNVVMAAEILNCEGWDRNDDNGDEDLEFADGHVKELVKHFEKPLTKSGFDGSLSNMLDQWHDLISYTKRYLDPSRIHYLRVWRRIFSSSRKERWNMILLLVELLFTIPISNAKVERLFSLMNRVKLDSRASLNESTLNNLIRIKLEGPTLQQYDPTPAIESWASSADRRPHQSERKPYKPRKSTKKLRAVLIDTDSTEESESDAED